MKRIAALAALALALTGCAVTGQGAAPGVAAEYGETHVERADVAHLQAAFEELEVPTHASSALTLLLLEPAIMEWAGQEGYLELATEELLDDQAAQWLRAAGDDTENPEVTPEMRDAVRLVLLLAVMLYEEEGGVRLVEAVQQIAEEGDFSPAYGDFTMEQFAASIQQLSTQEQNAASFLGPVSYLVYTGLNGFPAPDAPADWMSTGESGATLDEPVTAP